MEEYFSGTHEDFVYGGVPVIMVELCKEHRFEDADFIYDMESATRKISERFSEEETKEMLEDIFDAIDSQIWSLKDLGIDKWEELRYKEEQ